MGGDMKTEEIPIPASRYEDSDDCLADAAADVAAELGLELWEVEARWGEYRNEILVTVPEEAAAKKA
jgi:hypothetical protein